MPKNVVYDRMSQHLVDFHGRRGHDIWDSPADLVTDGFGFVLEKHSIFIKNILFKQQLHVMVLAREDVAGHL